MTPEPTWVTVDATYDGMAIRLAVLVFFPVIGIILGLAFRDGLAAFVRGFRRAFIRALGREAPPDWIVTDWYCAVCRSVNVHAMTRCRRCRSARADSELHATAPATPPDVIPSSIDGAGKRVTLEHNRAAHRDPGAAHWRVRVNGNVLGSAALRDGALALLGVVRGTDIVLFDPNGSGLAPYRITDLIAAFDRRALPLNEPCPEALRS